MNLLKYNYSDTEKKTLKKMFWNSGLVFASFNQVKMEGNAFCITMAPALQELYEDDEERKLALKRHDNFFNTHAVFLAFIAGIAYAMEREKVTKGSVDDDTIESIKVELMGPTAGIGDAFFFNCLRIIAAGIAIGLCSTGNVIGVLLFILLYGGSQMVARYYLIRIGYSMGTSFIDQIFQSGLMQSLTKSASILGIGMVGAMVASMVSVNLTLNLNVGETSVELFSIIDSIMPGLCSIILVFYLMSLIKKGVKPITLVIGILIFCILISFIGSLLV